MNIIDKTESKTAIDFERYRLRRFIDELPPEEIDTSAEPIDLADGRAGARRQSARRAASAPSGRSATSSSATSPAAAAASRAPSASRRDELLQEVQRRLRNKPEHRRGRARGSAGAGDRAHRQRRRPHRAAGASAARRRRRALHLGLDRFRGRSQDRLDQCRHPPPDAARPHARRASTSTRRAICARSTRRARRPASRCRSASWSARIRSIISPP